MLQRLERLTQKVIKPLSDNRCKNIRIKKTKAKLNKFLSLLLKKYEK